MTKVYFACSIRGGGDTSNYLAILEAIRAASAEVISEVFVHDALHLGGSPLPSREIYQRDIAMILEADVVISEVTNPSIGVGYELAYAEKLHKPILCLFDNASDRKLSAMIDGNEYNTVARYTKSSISEAISDFLRQHQ